MRVRIDNRRLISPTISAVIASPSGIWPLRQPPQWRDPALVVLQERGLELEQAHLEHLRNQGSRIAKLGRDDDGSALRRTIAAMHSGVEIIYQAPLESGRWRGRADFLRLVERPSRLGAWSYEVIDAKLARETRAGTVLQLCLYSHMVADIQGVLPEHMRVVVPRELVTFRVHDFLAYHRLVQRQLEAAVDPVAGPQATYPDSPWRNATFAAGGKNATAAGAPMTIFVSSRGYPSFRSTSFGAGAFIR